MIQKRDGSQQQIPLPPRTPVMFESFHHRETLSLIPSGNSAGNFLVPTSHDLLAEPVCDRFGQGLTRDLERLENRFQDFVTPRTVMASIRS